VQFANKVVVVTGAFGQLGRAMTKEILKRGGRAALLDVAEGALATGAEAKAWKVDLTSQQSVARVLEEVSAHFGGIDALVNIAGGFRWQTLEKSDDLKEWSAMFSLNLTTCVSASKGVLPHLQKRGAGRIVNIGSMAALKGGSGLGAYSASKAGVLRFTEALAEEVKLQGITVNAVMPSTIDTPQNRKDMPDANFDLWVKAEEIAGVICFLLSDGASAITGAALPITGRT